jgi:hypothetical protein
LARWLVPLLAVGLALIILLARGAALFSGGRGAPAPGDAPASQAQPAAPPAGEQAPPAALPEAEAISLDAIIKGEIASPGQQRAYAFDAPAGQQIFVWTAKYDDPMSQIKLRLLSATGDELANSCLGCGNLGVQTLKAGGRYTLVVGSDSEPATGTFELRVNVVPPSAAVAVPLDTRIAGDQPAPGAATIAAPGAKRSFSLSAPAGQQIFVWTAKYDGGMDQVKLRILDARGDELANSCLGCGNLGVQTLKAGGAYTLVVGSDNDPATGAFELRLSPVPPPETIAAPLPIAVSAGTIATPGAKQVYAFDAPAGQQIFVTSLRYDPGMDQIKLRLLDSLGDEVASSCLGCGNMGAQTLRKGGAYTLVVGSDNDPATGTYEISVSPVP